MPKDEIVVTVIGAGKMGLPLACQFASKGARVIACDVRKDVVKAINRGRCPIEEPGIAEVLKEAVNAGRMSATSDTAKAVGESDVVVVIVPVLLTPTNDADTSIIKEVTEAISRGLKPGTMVSYETTLPVGTTRSLAAILEQFGLTAADDFDLVFSPERVKSNLVLERLSQTPKVVGGFNKRAADRAEEFYHTYLGAPIINVGSLEAAEFVKLAGMVYRDVNIALSNELSRYADAIGVDFEPIIAAANTDGEAALLSPGIGVGGHCTPVYPYFLINDADRRGIPCELPSFSRTINDGQPGYFLDRVESSWKSLKGQNVVILGLAFRPQVKESICSPAFQLRDELVRRGANVYIQDPLFSTDELRQLGFQTWIADELPPVLILNTAHDEFRRLKLDELKEQGCEVFVDGRNAFSAPAAEQSGLVYIGVGRSFVGAGAPVDKHIPVIRPLVASRETAAAAAVIRSGWIMQGPQVAALEKEFAAYVGSKHACAVSSGTAALHLALLAVGVGPGDEVITASHSFIATANSIRYCGAIPVFVDIEPDTYNMAADLIEEAITDRTKAILCVHQVGMPCDIQKITALARRHNLRVVEDAACAAGSEVLSFRKWQRIGRPHGDAACFSFHPRKLLTTGDGGIITTDSDEIDQVCRLWRNHGINTKTGGNDSVGFNYRLTDVQAAIGRMQLQRLPALIEHRREQAARYQELLRGLNGVSLPREPEWAKSNWQSYCITFADEATRNEVSKHLADLKIDTRGGVMCAHREPAYAQEPWRCANESLETSQAAASTRLRHSIACQDRGLILPLYDGLADADLQRIAAAIGAVVSRQELAKL